MKTIFSWAKQDVQNNADRKYPIGKRSIPIDAGIVIV